MSMVERKRSSSSYTLDKVPALAVGEHSTGGRDAGIIEGGDDGGPVEVVDSVRNRAHTR